MALLLDWRNVGQPDADLQPLIDALRQGGIAILPTESGYVFAANDIRPLDQLAGAMGTESRRARLTTSASQIEEAGAQLPAGAKRILQRLWPSRVSVGVTSLEGCDYYRSPAHPVVEALSMAADFPLWIVGPTFGNSGEESAAEFADRSGESIAIIVDAGPIAVKPLTWIAVDSNGWRVEQPGLMAEAEIIAAAARWIVFLCTGNTCRSPMTEALFKTRLAQRLSCRIDELPARGYRIVSAGVAAYPGDAPSPEAVDVLREYGAELETHRSQPLTMEMVAHADYLIGMTRSHLLAVLTRYPLIGGSLRLLCGGEGDLDDPIGCGMEVYAACARTIVRHVDRLILDLECQ